MNRQEPNLEENDWTETLDGSNLFNADFLGLYDLPNHRCQLEEVR